MDYNKVVEFDRRTVKRSTLNTTGILASLGYSDDAQKKAQTPKKSPKLGPRTTVYDSLGYEPLSSLYTNEHDSKTYRLSDKDLQQRADSYPASPSRVARAVRENMKPSDKRSM